MKQQTHYHRIGLFALISIAILVLFLILLGAKDWFNHGIVAETYFNESVQGLEVGSPVKFRGVTIGQVEDIDVVNDVYGHGGLHADSKMMRYIYVKFSIKPNTHTSASRLEGTAALHNYVKQGLRVRLVTADLVGNVFLEMNFVNPEKNPILSIDWKPNDPYIPSARSALSRFTNNIDKIFSELGSIEYQKMMKDIDHMVNSTTTLIDDMNTHHFSLQLTESLQHIGNLANSLQKVIDGNEGKAFVKSMQQNSMLLQQSLNRFNQSMSTLNQLLSRTDEITQNQQQSLIATLNNLQQISQNLTAATQTMNNNPSSLLFGQPKPKVEPGQ